MIQQGGGAEVVLYAYVDGSARLLQDLVHDVATVVDVVCGRGEDNQVAITACSGIGAGGTHVLEGQPAPQGIGVVVAGCDEITVHERRHFHIRP